MENNVPDRPGPDAGKAPGNPSGQRPAEGSIPPAPNPPRAEARDGRQSQRRPRPLALVPGPDRTAGAVVDQTVDRSLSSRREAARSEVERLMRAAFAVIEKSGGLDPKVSDILAEARLSNQAFYRHFRGKHELLVAVLDEGILGLADYLAGRMAVAPDPVSAIREWVRGMAAQALDPDGARASRPFALARGRIAEAFPAEVARSRAQLTAPLRRALEDAVESGDLPAAAPDQDAESMYHLMMGFLEARLVEGRIPDVVEVDRLEAFVMAGLERGARKEQA